MRRSISLGVVAGLFTAFLSLPARAARAAAATDLGSRAIVGSFRPGH